MSRLDHRPAPVLISGAGPSGMMLGLWLLKYNVPFRLVDKAKEPYTTSRAIVAHARTLEFYRMLGIADDLIEVGTKLERTVINKDGIRKGALNIADAGYDQSYYPFVLSITQDEHEAVLLSHLEKHGVSIERGVEVCGITSSLEDKDSKRVKVKLRSTEGSENEIEASYVIGCDGAHSGVRHATNISMDGGTYARRFFVADIFVKGAMHTQGQVNTCFSQSEFVIILALPHKESRARIVGFVPENGKDLDSVTFEDCLPSITKSAPSITIDEVRWFATYKVHHRVASSFQHGKRVFLCGDSAHLHSPLGGQGMNTGLGDVSNLAWKLATAWHAEAASVHSGLGADEASKLLGTYSSERKPIAEQLVHSTDRAFTTITAPTFMGWLVRNVLLPYLFPLLTSSAWIRGRVFPRLSQIGIEYESSALSQGTGRGQARPGQRLPWIRNAEGAAGVADNHSLLNGKGWQAHVFGTGRVLPEHTEQLLHRSTILVHTFPMTEEAKRRGFLENALYLVRPDGHIGLIVGSPSQFTQKLERYLDACCISRLGANP